MACDEWVNRNQGILLLTVTVVLFLLVYRLNGKGILSYRELLDSGADV
jgi:hypothetical protein